MLECALEPAAPGSVHTVSLGGSLHLISNFNYLSGREFGELY